MTLPDVEVISRTSPPSSNEPVDTGKWFVAGMTERGPDATPVLVRNLSQYVAAFGERVSYGFLYDALEAFFREGGQEAYVSRVVGPSAAVATVNLSDGTDDTLQVDANGSGDWYDDVDIVVAVSGGTFTLTVKDGDGNTLEASPSLDSPAAAVAWAVDSDYIVITDLSVGTNPEAGTSSLTGGDDDRSNATDASWEGALDAFAADLGPGQVSQPGRTGAQAATDTLEHAAAKRRFALLDLVDSADDATLVAAAATLRALSNARYGAAFAPWATIPGLSIGTTRTVPYSAIEAGMIARNEATGKGPNEPTAGVNGIAQYATGLSQSAWDDTEREALNDGGVNVARVMSGAVRTYGYRTLVDPTTAPAWLQASNARLDMAIKAKAAQIAERFNFAQIDGRKRKIGEFGGELAAMLLPFWTSGQLYGETFQEAATVDVGSQVNTPETIAAQELHAILAVRMSPFAERVIIEIVKVENSEVL